MKVVLLENIKGIGQKGEVKEVKDGYGMNFLIPQKKAVIATQGSVKQAEVTQAKQAESEKKMLEENKAVAEKINGQKVSLKAKAQDDKLFGALSENDIKEAMASAGLELGDGKFNITSPIKTTGEHSVEIVWGNDIKAKFTLVVEGEK